MEKISKKDKEKVIKYNKIISETKSKRQKSRNFKKMFKIIDKYMLKNANNTPNILRDIFDNYN